MSSEPYLCNLILPGAGKSGTSSLHVMLGRHPELSMSEPKELQHFSFDALYERGAEAHNAQFARRDGVTHFGESSQCYMVHRHAMERIARDCRDPRIIFLLRDPVERLLSQYAWTVRLGLERRPLRAAIEAAGDETRYELEPAIGMYRERGGYVAFSRYTTWIPNWQSEFGAERVLLLRSEDLRADPAATLRRCWRFLDVPEIPFESQVVTNTTAATYRVALPGPVMALARAIPPQLKGPAYRSLRDAVWRWLTPEPDTRLADAERRWIEDLLADDIAFHAALGST